jgi:hypothetical protein
MARVMISKSYPCKILIKQIKGRGEELRWRREGEGGGDISRKITKNLLPIDAWPGN